MGGFALLMDSYPNFMDKAAALDKAFAGFIKGKSVAVMARGASLESCDGEHVDSFDVVVRMHRPMPGVKEDLAWECPPFVPVDWQERVGTRTDIFYHDFNGVTEEVLHRYLAAFFEEGGRFLCVDYQNFNAQRHSATHRYIESKIHPVRKVRPELYWHLHEQGLSHALSGTEILCDVLGCDPVSVFVAGFAGRGEVIGGDSKLERDLGFIRQLYLERDNISVDGMMQEIFDAADEADESYTPYWRRARS